MKIYESSNVIGCRASRLPHSSGTKISALIKMIEYGEPDSWMWRRAGEGWRRRVSHVYESVQVRGLSSFLVHMQGAIHQIKIHHGFTWIHRTQPWFRNIHKHRIEETHLPFIQFVTSLLSDIKPNETRLASLISIGMLMWACCVFH